ncbi:517_t:CDS:1, partial [Racocetra persica]
LGIFTEGNKADLVQRLKEYQTNELCEKNVDGMKFTNDEADNESVISDLNTETTKMLNPETQTLRELLQKNKRLLHAALSSVFPQDTAETADNPQQTNKTKKQKLQAEEEDNSDPLIESIVRVSKIGKCHAKL